MQKKENEVSSDALAEKGACKLGIEEFKRWYPNGHATLTEVLRKLQILANTAHNPLKYVDYARWLFDNFPPTQEPLVLNELTEKVIIHNGNLTINCDIDGDYVIIVNGNLNIKGNVNLTGWALIWAKTINAENITADGDARIWAKTINAENITADGDARIWADRKVKANDITVYGDARIWAGKTINAENITADAKARIWANKTIDATNIAAYGNAGIWAGEINAQNIMEDGVIIHGKINIIHPSSNPQNVTQPAN